MLQHDNKKEERKKAKKTERKKAELPIRISISETLKKEEKGKKEKRKRRKKDLGTPKPFSLVHRSNIRTVVKWALPHWYCTRVLVQEELA